MNKEEQKAYLEEYHRQKEKGVPFFPDIIFKDAVVSLLIFLILIGLAYFKGAPLDARANPADTTYTPRPEWYFLFLFQLLKYFPGKYEVIGAVIIPTLVILTLFFLPLIDRRPERRAIKRLPLNGVVAFGLFGIIFLTVSAVREAPPPSMPLQGDQTAALYAKNCAACHGTSIQVKQGTNLHSIIAQGKHEGMPAWSGDLTSDQIDALAGFILSPGGSQLFTDNCAACHKVDELVAGNPMELKKALDLGKAYPAHTQVDVPDWSTVLSDENRTALLNFLIAPDGKRLFATNCSPCHGSSIAYEGNPPDLKKLISEGGMHLAMPAWKEKLPADQLDLLASYVYAPSANPAGQTVFRDKCSGCHGEKLPQVASLEEAKQAIESGGAHVEMPVWGNVLTSQQLDALVSYTMQSSTDTNIDSGQKLFSQYCTPCHGNFGEGGPNPSRIGDTIAPISTGEYLKTRDDITIKAVISEGQPDFGMSPFSSSNGGPLSDEDIDSIVAYIRSWQARPPVELPPEAASFAVLASAKDLYKNLCAQCHGVEGEGGVGPSFQSKEFQSSRSDDQLREAINQGHPSTPMIRWGDILSAKQVDQLVKMIRGFEKETPVSQPTSTAATGTPESSTAEPTPVATESATTSPTFEKDILPILEDSCQMCHGESGEWDASSYQSVMETGENAPVIVPGDPDGSLLMQKLLNTQTTGSQMPPGNLLSKEKTDLIAAWIAAGAPEK